MGLYLLAGTPGQSKGAAAEKIAVFLEQNDITVGELANVETELLEFFPEYDDTDEALQEARVRLIGERAQDEIKEKWAEAYRNAVAKATSGNPDVAIVSLCFAYYRYETYEFYSPVDCNAIRDSKPKSALTLIDDIFEVYYRLSQSRQVFNIQQLVERTFPATESSSRDLSDLRRLYKDALALVVGTLLRILTWREKEIECAANVSRTIGCEHSVLAVKHPVETGARLLLGSTTAQFEKLGVSYPVYVSHPISRPRRDRSSQGVWPSFVKDLDGVVAGLSDEPEGSCHVVPVMPTAIDEFRILDDGTYLHPCLIPRWKLQEGELLFSLPQPPAGKKAFEDYGDYESRGVPLIFDPPIDSTGRRVGLPLSDAEVSGMMRNLRESIRLQMAGRDHMLVRQCPGFFLYRPLYGKFELSSGVTVEIHTFNQIRKYSRSVPGSRNRLVAFVHDTTDATGHFLKNDNNKFRDCVPNASAALRAATRKLVDESNSKTKKPSSPDNETVAKALQEMGNPESAARTIHSEMFPATKTGPVGGEQPLAWNETKELLKNTIEEQRVQALSSDIIDAVSYTFSQSEPVWDFNPVGERFDTYVDVVDGLDDDRDRRNSAATRAREFFAGVAMKRQVENQEADLPVK